MNVKTEETSRIQEIILNRQLTAHESAKPELKLKAYSQFHWDT